MDHDLYECEPVQDALGRWRLIATAKACGAQPFWLNEKTFHTYKEALAYLDIGVPPEARLPTRAGSDEARQRLSRALVPELP